MPPRRANVMATRPSPSGGDGPDLMDRSRTTTVLPAMRVSNVGAPFIPPWVAMSDSAVPETWADARKLILGNAPWILLLVAVERAIEGHFTQAVVSLVLCFIALGIAIHWKAFEGLGTREGRRRLAFIFIIVGAAILMVGIYLLARAPIVGEQQIGGGAAGVAGIPATDKAATPALQVTPTSRPKPVITELLAESG